MQRWRTTEQDDWKTTSLESLQIKVKELLLENAQLKERIRELENMVELSGMLPELENK